MDEKNKKKAGTFQLNKHKPIHNWYSYIEGYSSCLVADELEKLKDLNIQALYDPFGGTGTTPLVGVQHHIKSYYSESNPFMLTVIDAKINSVKSLIESNTKSKYLEKFLNKIEKLDLKYDNKPITWNGFEKYFNQDVLYQILEIKKRIKNVKDIDSQKILMVTLSSIIVPVSNTIRNGDLRYATEKELNKKNYDVKRLFLNKLNTIINDINSSGNMITIKATKLSEDAKNITLNNKIDCVITSPPYLNGTNYIRNTKLELKLNDFIKSEEDLPKFHSKGIIAGINNVSKRNKIENNLNFIEKYIKKLEPVVYDSRITKMVIGYFNDMNKVIEKLAAAMTEGGIFVMDIGDSQFAGVHIPTHDILSIICENHGFKKYDETILRERRSKNNMILSQRILRFKLNKTEKSNKLIRKTSTTPPENNIQLNLNTLAAKHEEEFENFYKKAENFMTIMPYKQEPYSGRNWGHSWHSLCSYHGKLKPAIAHFMVKNFTKKGDIILDPLSGVGTIPFEACLQGRIGIGNDLSEMAYVVSKAKLEKPNYEDVQNELNKLEDYIKEHINKEFIKNVINENKDFGYNKTLIEYFHEDTFNEIICARQYFLDNMQNISPEKALIFSAFMHVLHGNRPYALSRQSHPLTPYAPKGEFIYKNIIKHIKEKIDTSYKVEDFGDFVLGSAIYGDYTEIKGLDNKVDYIICSPPFADSIRFYMQNWMRLWLCGWHKEDFKNAEKLFLDAKQKKDFGIYDSFFEMCYKVLKTDGKVILHLGKTSKLDMAEELQKYSKKYFDTVYVGTESVSDIEKHGIRDKGNTIEHEYLFLIKKNTSE